MHDTLIILAAYVLMAVITILGTIVATVLLVPGGVATMRAARTPGAVIPEPPASYLAANLIVSLAGAMAAGMFVMRYASPPPQRSILGLTGFVLLVGVSMALKGRQPGQPRWYPWIIPLVGAAGVWLGAMM